jgi:hypothetical protein
MILAATRWSDPERGAPNRPTDRATSTQWKPQARATLPLPHGAELQHRHWQLPGPRWHSSSLAKFNGPFTGKFRAPRVGRQRTVRPAPRRGRRARSLGRTPHCQRAALRLAVRAPPAARPEPPELGPGPLAGPAADSCRCWGRCVTVALFNEVPYWQRADGNHGARGEPKAGLCPGLPVALGHSRRGGGHPASKPEPRRAAGTMRYR